MDLAALKKYYLVTVESQQATTPKSLFKVKNLLQNVKKVPLKIALIGKQW